MINKHFISTAILMAATAFMSVGLMAKDVISLNEGWHYRKGTARWFIPMTGRGQQAPQTPTITLPHTFNQEDFMSDEGYYRGEGTYTRELEIPESYRGKRIFLRFEGAGSRAMVSVNGRGVGVHKGAYNSFVFEITDFVQYGAKNNIMVVCDNSKAYDIAPQGGDFNLYGGLYRDVWLEVSEETCIDPLFYGSKGFFVTQRFVNDDVAQFRAEVLLSTKSNYAGCDVVFKVADADGKTVFEKTIPYINNDKASVNIDIRDPHLWNGMEDPYLYTASATLRRDGKELDKVEDKIGVRTFYVDPDKGFFLNGKHLKLRGVSRHQDWAGIASALKKENHLKDLDIIQEMGVNSLRLAHYPQAHFMFEEADRRGFVVWEEIPFVGGYSDCDDFDENLKLQLRELIYQNYNHPSICFWGLFNEIVGSFDKVLAELNDIAHEIDPTRVTTAATYQQGSFNFITDLIAWNKYFGWYQDKSAGFAKFFDDWHKEHPEARIAISEYGAGAAFSQHVGVYNDTDDDVRQTSRGRWHPMEKQTFIHMDHLKMITERDYIWGSYAWNMFDFASAMRREGDTNNLNDKGLVSQDRTRRKDAFYLYKANWNKSEPTVHLCSKDYVQRKEDVTDIILFTTAPSARLFINGKPYGKAVKTDAYATVQWKGVKLAKGANHIEVRTEQGNETADWTVE